MKQYHSDREQEEEEDMEHIHHQEEAARYVKTLPKLWKKKKMHELQKCWEKEA